MVILSQAQQSYMLMRYAYFRFFDDIDLLRQRWVSENTDSVAEL